MSFSYCAYMGIFSLVPAVSVCASQLCVLCNFKCIFGFSDYSDTQLFGWEWFTYFVYVILLFWPHFLKYLSLERISHVWKYISKVLTHSLVIKFICNCDLDLKLMCFWQLMTWVCLPWGMLSWMPPELPPPWRYWQPGHTGSSPLSSTLQQCNSHSQPSL